MDPQLGGDLRERVEHRPGQIAHQIPELGDGDPGREAGRDRLRQHHELGPGGGVTAPDQRDRPGRVVGNGLRGQRVRGRRDLDRGHGDRAHQGRRPNHRPTSTPARAIIPPHDGSGPEVGRLPASRRRSDERTARHRRVSSDRFDRIGGCAGQHVVDRREELARRFLGHCGEHALPDAGDDAADLGVGVVAQPGAARTVLGHGDGHVGADRPGGTRPGGGEHEGRRSLLVGAARPRPRTSRGSPRRQRLPRCDRRPDRSLPVVRSREWCAPGRPGR